LRPSVRTNWATASSNAPRVGKRWATEIVQALSEQTGVVQGTRAATVVLPRLAQQLAALRRQLMKSRRKSRDSFLHTPSSGPDRHASWSRDDNRSPSTDPDERSYSIRLPPWVMKPMRTSG
jgi:hypothetical protein